MQDKKVSFRLSQFELLRIVAMFMIIACHLVSHGVQHRTFDDAYQLFYKGTLVNQMQAAFLSPGGGVGVALFL